MLVFFAPLTRQLGALTGVKTRKRESGEAESVGRVELVLALTAIEPQKLVVNTLNNLQLIHQGQ